MHVIDCHWGRSPSRLGQVKLVLTRRIGSKDRELEAAVEGRRESSQFANAQSRDVERPVADGWNFRFK